MHLSWLGSTAVKLQTKPRNEEVVIVIDPYKSKEGTSPKSITPQIALFGRGQGDSVTLSGDPFILNAPGEVEIKDVLITAVQGESPDKIMFRVDAENMSIGHIGNTKNQLTEAELDAIAGVDVLFVPVGGGDVFDAENAVKAVNEIEPRVVIPIAYKSDNDPKADDVSNFLKEIGLTPVATDKKLILKKKDLPLEETALYVLTKE